MSPAPVSASARRSVSLIKPLREGAAGEGVLHHREADQHDDQHEAADQRRRHEVGGRAGPSTVKLAGGDPGDQEEPGRHQHHGAVVAVGREMHHEDEADAGDRRDRDARDAGGDRRIDDRERRRAPPRKMSQKAVTWL